MMSSMLRATTTADLRDLPQPLHLALGVFDGVHMGHQAVIGAAIDAAQNRGGSCVVVTFDPHPIRFLSPERAPRQLLASLDHKARILERMGVDAMLALSFDEALAALSAEQFLTMLCQEGRMASISVGEDWRFGKGRSGDVAFLRAKAAEWNFSLHALAPVMHEGERISSTRIRQAIRDGALAHVRAMLGRSYGVEGEVILGQQLGRTIGFPTANLALHEELLPPDGVWIVRAQASDQSWSGVANLGLRPTVDGSNRVFEVHLFDTDADFYGKTLEVTFLHHLRSEQKFPSLDALKKQIASDVESARRWLADGLM
jgi:riboflavin kinase/FMN adenylyltransferase